MKNELTVLNCAISVKSKSKASENLWADTDEEDNADSIDGDANNDEDGNDGQANFTILCVEPYIFEDEDLFLGSIIGIPYCSLYFFNPLFEVKIFDSYTP
jgi:hypothetical protein